MAHEQLKKWKPGDNKGGNTLVKHFWSFRRSLTRAIAKGDGVLLDRAARMLLVRAAQGEPWAIKELALRLDGAPHQSIEVTHDGTSRLDQCVSIFVGLAASLEPGEAGGGDAGRGGERPVLPTALPAPKARRRAPVDIFQVSGDPAKS
jgi:hypothetical protein